MDDEVAAQGLGDEAAAEGTLTMPTAYTAMITDRDEPATFKEFALACARNFGALIHMRDEQFGATIPEKIHGTDIDDLDERVRDAETRLAEAERLTVDQARSLMAKENEEYAAYVAESNAKGATTRARVDSTLAEVNAWEPPTPNHVGLKKFMIEQLETELYYSNPIVNKTVAVAPEVWLAQHAKMARDRFFEAKNDRARSVKCNAEAQAWVDALRDSLKDVETTK